jgi:uncharacterized protein DUF4279
MTTESFAYFGVFDFGSDPCIVTAIMGVEPTTAWVKGEQYAAGGPSLRRTFSRWSLSSGLPRTEPVERHLEALLAKLEPRQKEIKEIAARFPVMIGVAHAHEHHPGFHLEPPILERLARVGLPVDFEQSGFGSEEPA